MSVSAQTWEGGPCCRLRANSPVAGSVTVWVSALLFFLALGSLSAFRALEHSSGLVRAELDRIELHGELARRADSLVASLADDPTPGADSSHDPIWRSIATINRSGIDARLSDVSTLPGETPFIKLEARAVPALEQLFLEHGADADSAHSAAALLATRCDSTLRVSPPIPETVLGDSFAALRPLLSCEPMVNVNLARARFIAAELFSEASSREQALRTLESILTLRASAEIDEAALARLYPEDARARRRPSRLGVRTWVWKLLLSSRRNRLTRTLVRLHASPPACYRVIADRFELLPPSPLSIRTVPADDN